MRSAQIKEWIVVTGGGLRPNPPVGLVCGPVDPERNGKTRFPIEGKIFPWIIDSLQQRVRGIVKLHSLTPFAVDEIARGRHVHVGVLVAHFRKAVHHDLHRSHDRLDREWALRSAEKFHPEYVMAETATGVVVRAA